MSTQLKILRKWAADWSKLKAWGRPLDEVNVTVREREGICSTGLARPGLREAVVRAGSDMADALITILHEFAHLCVPNQTNHGPAWRMRYADAVCEVTGIQISTVGNIGIVDANAQGAVRVWWETSGNQFAARLLGVT